MPTWYLLLALAFIVANGVFVAAEFAIVKVRSTQLAELAASGSSRARMARRILKKLDTYLAATQLGVTLASLALGWIGEPAFAHLIQAAIGGPGWLSAAAIHTTAILLGELAPKFIAIGHSESMALFVARPLRMFGRLFKFPLVVVYAAARATL